MPTNHSPSVGLRGVGSRCRPAEPVGAGPQAFDEAAVRPRVAGLGVDVGLVADAQLDRVDAAGDGEFVHRDLEGEHAGALAGGAHPERHGHVELRRAGGWSCGSRAAYIIRDGDRGLLGELLDGGGLFDDVVAERGERAVAFGAQPDLLDGGRAVADEGEHLLAGQREA